MGKMKICKFCGKVYFFEKGKCLVWGVKCMKCGGRNYFVIICIILIRKVYNLRDEFFDDSDMEYIISIVV